MTYRPTLLPRRFWLWLIRLSERRLRETVYHDRKCEQCGTWASVVPISEVRDNDPGIEYETTVCGRCGAETVWDMVRSMLPIFVKVTPGKPGPLVEEKP